MKALLIVIILQPVAFSLIHVFYPRNNSVIGSHTCVGFELLSDRMHCPGETSCDLLSHTPLHVSILSNGNLVYTDLLNASIFDCVLGDGVFEPGKVTTLTFIVRSTRDNFLETATVMLRRVMAGNENWDILTAALRNKGESHFAYLVAEFGRQKSWEFWSQLSTLNAQRLELYSLGNNGNNEKLDVCGALTGSVVSYHCYSSIDPVYQSIYVDHSLLFLEGIESAEMSPTVLLAEVLKVTRRSLWVFLPVGSALTAIVEGVVGPHGERFQLARFRSRGSGSRGEGRVEGGTGEEGRETESVEVWEGVSAWVLQVASVRDEPTVAESLEKRRGSKRSMMPLENNKLQNPESKTKAGSLESDLPAGSLARRLERLADSIQPSIDISADAHLESIETETGFETRKLLENYDVGRSFILLENACLSEQNVVVLFHGNSTSGGSRIVDEEYLAADEDRGFLYTNLRFLETSADSSLAQDIKSRWPLIPGLTGLTMAAGAGNIVHEMEPLVQLVFAVLLRYHCEDRSKEKVCLKNRALRIKYDYILSHMDRIVLGSLGSRNLNDWILSFIGHVIGFMKSREAPRIPAIYTRDHLFPDYIPESSGANGVCFEKLLLFGRSNTHVTFFGKDFDAGGLFREFIYEQLGIAGTPNVPTQRLSPTSYLNSAWPFSGTDETQSSVSYRKRLIRVTIVLRPVFMERNILNFDELLATIASFPNVDIQWLRGHIRSFDFVPFEEQVSIMAATDIFISVHGATLINGMLMRPGSAVIDILNGPLLEYIFEPPLREADVSLDYVYFNGHPVVNGKPNNWITHCPPLDSTPSHCFSDDPLHGCHLHCVSFRICSVVVDLWRFKYVFVETINRVIVNKFLHFPTT